MKKNVRSLFAVDVVNETISASKATLTRAKNPDSKEYVELKRLLAENRGFSVVEKESRKKTTYEGMDFAFMRAYIRIQKDSEELMAQFEMVKMMNGDKYPIVKKWFLDTFKDENNKFNMEKAKREISAGKIQMAKVMVKKTMKSNESTTASSKVVNY